MSVTPMAVGGYGWKCPGCGTMYAPHVHVCEECSPLHSISPGRIIRSGGHNSHGGSGWAFQPQVWAQKVAAGVSGHSGVTSPPPATATGLRQSLKQALIQDHAIYGYRVAVPKAEALIDYLKELGINDADGLVQTASGLAVSDPDGEGTEDGP